MNLIMIFCPPAFGKMTIGQEIQKINGYKLFHDHMSLELVNQFFDFKTPSFIEMGKKIRFSLFGDISQSDIAGLLFTIVWAFDHKEDEEYTDEIIDAFERRNHHVHIVELICGLEEQIRRNKHDNSLMYSPSKRNIELTEMRLLNHEKEYRMNSV